MTVRRARGWPLLPLAALLLAGCADRPRLGPVSEPEIYPDRTSPDATWESFLWAWKTGDVPVLQTILGWILHQELERDIARHGAEAVSGFFRRDAEGLAVVEGEWRLRGGQVAYLRVVLSSASVPRVEVDFSFVQRVDGWAISERRPVR